MKILLINPYETSLPAVSPWPHLGLAILATRARDLGHQAYVVDYAFTPEAPPLGDLVSRLSPDLFGLTLYTAHMKPARQAIQKIRRLSDAPIALGGPHATLYANDLARENLADYIFRGECDTRFDRELEFIKQNPRSVVVSAEPPDLAEITAPDFQLAHGSAAMTYYPIQLSRGCPYSCSFCSVKNISTRRVRFRDIGLCLDEIEQSVRKHRKLHFVRIVDDCPTFDLGRFKTFLHGYIQRGLRKPLHIDNLRADKIDDEMLGLIRRIGVDHLCIGVESGNKRVFELINKGEKMEDIVRAARLIKQYGFRLYTCFIIGLPGSTAESEMDSIRLARSLKPNWIYWNLFQPHKGTQAREWFEENGRILEEEDKSSLIGLTLETTDAPCDTPEFPAEERKRMQIVASLITGAYWLNPRFFIRYGSLIKKNRLWRAFFVGLPSALRINLEMLFHRAGRMAKASVKKARFTSPCA